MKKMVMIVGFFATLLSLSLSAEVMDVEKYSIIATEIIRESMKMEGADTQKNVTAE